MERIILFKIAPPIQSNSAITISKQKKRMKKQAMKNKTDQTTRGVDRLIGIRIGIEIGISHMHAENDAIKVKLLLCYI